jgi:hypothetical protein
MPTMLLFHKIDGSRVATVIRFHERIHVLCRTGNREDNVSLLDFFILSIPLGCVSLLGFRQTTLGCDASSAAKKMKTGIQHKFY